MKVLIAAGASGGHVYPALATAVVLRDRGHDVTFAGGDRIEARVVPEAGFAFHALPVRRPPSVRVELMTPRGIAAMGSIAFATLRARGLVRRLRPDVVLGMGGFASVPVSLAAALPFRWASRSDARRRGHPPLVLHEQNAHLSFAQKIPLRGADVLAMGLPIEEGVQHARTELVGNPVREAIARLATLTDADRDVAKRDARIRLGLSPDATTLFVLGGSLGSGPLNEVLPTLDLPAAVQVLHASGAAYEAAVRAAWAGSPNPAHVVGFIETMQDAYLAADVAVSRSGAITVAELAVAGLPAVLVPLLTLARGDQAANARVLERAGGAVIVDQADPAFAQRLTDELRVLLTDPAARSAMGAAARSVARPDASARLADVVESVAREGTRA